MLKQFCLLLLITAGAARGQEIFQKDQVDKPAEPVGGQIMLSEFLTHNIRQPFANRVEGTQGKVEIKGVIEPDGSTSSLEIVRSLNKESDNETLRVFGIFRGWKPAEKDGKPVRQWFSYSLGFGAGELDGFYKDAYEFDFLFDGKYRKVKEENEAMYRIRVAVDTNGIPVGRVQFSTRTKGRWSAPQDLGATRVAVESGMLSLLLGVEEGQLGQYVGPSDAFIVKVGIDPFETGLPEYVITSDGRIVRELLPGLFSKVSYASGRTAKVTLLESDVLSQTISWHPNSILKEKHYTQKINDSTSLEKIIQVFDSSGVQQVVKGNGHISGGGHIWGEGEVRNGYRVGTWRSFYPDGTLRFEELYDEGKLVRGKSLRDGKEFQYTQHVTQPRYKSAMADFYRFLASNIRYPAEASRNRIQGRVMLSVMVEPGGNISNVEVTRSAGPLLDAEAVRVIMLSSGKWIAGQDRGIPVRSTYSVPVGFQLE